MSGWGKGLANRRDVEDKNVEVLAIVKGVSLWNMRVLTWMMLKRGA